MPHRFIPNSPLVKEMLEEIGAGHIEDLFRDIPPEIRTDRLDLPEPLPEQEARSALESILERNKTRKELPMFLGGGSWFHFIPAHVDYLAGRGEFLTSYTPYQAETSQGMLQALFEYQSLMAELVSLEIVNASLYDWATALGEAALMSARVTRRKRILIPHYISPERRSVLENYARGPGLEIVKVRQSPSTGQLDLDDLNARLDENTAAVYIENPGYLGFLEERVEEISNITHEAGSLFVVGVNPISLGVIKPPGEYGADIVVGEGQPLGNPVSFGGPSLGIFACRNESRFLRQIPGRLVGMTTTLRGERAFCIVLQTREQHIRRERATSNICSNETLCALRAAVYLATLGPKGLRRIAETCMGNAHYLMKCLSKIEGLEAPVFKAFHFNEFVLRCTTGLDIGSLNRALLERGVQGGHILKKEFPELGEAELLSTTEVHSKSDLDRFVAAVEEIVGGNG